MSIEGNFYVLEIMESDCGDAVDAAKLHLDCLFVSVANNGAKQLASPRRETNEWNGPGCRRRTVHPLTYTCHKWPSVSRRAQIHYRCQGVT